MILVTGPTGSGKTTTLYTCLNEIKSAKKNIITLEDPVEYCLPFIKQSQVNAQIGFNFSQGLRAILRQDPDIIMVGEIRDCETANIAIQAALTGHLVFSTLHTTDAVGAPIRLVNMGVEPFLIASSLICVVAQRLIRTVCTECCRTYQIQSGNWDEIPFREDITQFSKGQGCQHCFKSGYKGRTGIHEVLLPNQEICSAITRQASSDEIRDLAVRNGMTTLRQSAIEKIQQGLTTPEEVLRVTRQLGDN